MNGEDKKKRRIRSAEDVGTAEGHGVGKHNPPLTSVHGLIFLRLLNNRLALPLDLS
jgi:hypothetical protein